MWSQGKRSATRLPFQALSVPLKAKAVQASQQPGVSTAAMAMAHGINANLVRRRVHEMARPPIDALAVNTSPVGFISLPMPATSAPPESSGDPIRIEARRGSTIIAVTWPASGADARSLFGAR
jgi:transposase